MKFVLSKQDHDTQLTDDALKALSKQKSSFIKLYPNPFKEDLIISYTLKESSYVEVKISDIKGLKTVVVKKGKAQKAGDYRYFLNGTGLEKGLYVVSIITNNEKKTRIIVKK